MPARQRNPRGEGTRLRDELLAGAQRILERTGNEDDVTLRAVAREVGVSAPSIYAHFADGRAMVDALVDRTFAELSTLLKAARDGAEPGERLFAICKAYIDFGVEQPERYLTLFERRRTLERSELPADGNRAFLYANGAESFAILAAAISEATDITSGSAEEDAALLWAGLHGYTSLRSSMPRFPWFADEERVCRLLVDRATLAARTRAQKGV
ncbi:TetR/AcrR family transcriptional regulator [Mycolicibacterium sp. BiH015]|uniref:TetR/AcrR family transcriptional regulator n=1 Tax=Mycolicibacterium sp. BiH015 TaxID=3018808 RepID=UPI0022E1884B|nr:TetR/AcrR family transcriptional regulator [Mycolicibacterium sp. BiH015]MDA2889988.1 TetR/AcrR family transcriptional regulator [Mycolicibacterium sp. BiH015]